MSAERRTDVIRTPRLDLHAATMPSIAAACRGSAALRALFGAEVPGTWPPLYIDDNALA